MNTKYRLAQGRRAIRICLLGLLVLTALSLIAAGGYPPQTTIILARPYPNRNYAVA